MAKITVLGGGFGTALAVMLYSTQQHDITIWSALPEEIDQEFYDTVKDGDMVLVNADEEYVEIL